jgi:cell division septum initiation protein DivIVA
MNKTLEIIENKIKKAVDLIDHLNDENKILADENRELREELAELRAKLSEAASNQNEIADTVKIKLGNIVNRLATLEHM